MHGINPELNNVPTGRIQPADLCTPVWQDFAPCVKELQRITLWLKAWTCLCAFPIISNWGGGGLIQNLEDFMFRLIQRERGIASEKL